MNYYSTPRMAACQPTDISQWYTRRLDGSYVTPVKLLSVYMETVRNMILHVIASNINCITFKLGRIIRASIMQFKQLENYE